MLSGQLCSNIHFLIQDQIAPNLLLDNSKTNNLPSVSCKLTKIVPRSCINMAARKSLVQRTTYWFQFCLEKNLAVTTETHQTCFCDPRKDMQCGCIKNKMKFNTEMQKVQLWFKSQVFCTEGRWHLRQGGRRAAEEERQLSKEEWKKPETKPEPRRPALHTRALK